MPKIPHFEENENSHMMYVKRIFICLKIILIVSFIACLSFIEFLTKKRIIKKIARLTWKYIIAIIFIFVSFLLFLILTFDTSFITFHYLFFEGKQIFFPVNSYMIEIFPEKFFLQMFIFMIIIFIIESIAAVSMLMIAGKNDFVSPQNKTKLP